MESTWVLTDIGGVHYRLPDGWFVPIAEQPYSRDEIQSFPTREAAQAVVRELRKKQHYLKVVKAWVTP